MKSIKQKKIEYAIKLYMDEKVSLDKASEIADISIWEMLDEMKKRNIPLKYRLSDAELEIQETLKKYGKI